MGSELEKLRKKLGLDEERVKNSTPQTSSAGSNLSQLRKSLGLDGQGSTSRVTYSSDDIAPVSKKVQSRMTVSNYLSGNSSLASSSYAAKQNEDIAPTKGKKVDFFKKGAFEDGYQMWDITKTILGTAGDAGLNAVKGAGSLVEGVTDLAQYGAAGVADAMGEDAWADKTRKRAQENRIEEWTQGLTDYFDKNSVLAKTSDSILQGIGQVGGILATGGLGAAAGLSGAGVTALTTGVMGLSGAGSGMGEAYESGASDEEAAVYGAISGAADALTELVFGGLGKTVNALGFSKGLSSADDMIAKAVSDKFKNQIAKNITQFGVKAGAEGLEEVMAGFLQAAGKKATYMSEKDFKEILEDENLMEQFIVGSMTSGMIQSGLVPGTKNGSLVEANKTGSDFLTGLSKNETAVVKKEVENRIAEIEKKGEKLTARQKSNLEAEVIRDMEKGYISIDTIEEALGGETYANYKQVADWEDSLLNEFNTLRDEFTTLNKMKNGERTGEQDDRRAELRSILEEKDKQLKNVLATSGRDTMKTQLGNEVRDMVKGDRLVESYNEQERKKQDFKADYDKFKGSKFEDAAKKTLDNAIKSGANNSNRVRDLVEWSAKVSGDSGVSFDFKSGDEIKADFIERQTAEIQKLEGITNRSAEQSKKLADMKDLLQKVESGEVKVNGNITENGVVLNLNSPNPLNRVVGHEVTHSFEKAKSYDALKESLYAYAKNKGVDIDAEIESRKLRYEGVKDADPEAELVADLVGDYLFNDSDYISHLSTQNRNIFQKIYDEIKYLCKVATVGSKEARELEKVKRAFEKAYREGGKAQTDTKYSVSETTDGRFAAVVDSDILSNIDTSSWDKTTKNEARKAASEALKQFSDGIVVDGITRKVNKTSRREYTRSKYTEWLYDHSPDIFADKMRAADVADDIVVVATNWQRDGGLKHPRTDDFVDFDHGNTLIVSGNAKYNAEVVVGITDTGEAVLYDVVDMTPATFDIKKEESPATATTQNAIGDIKGDSFDNKVAQKDNGVKYSLSDITFSDSSGRQLTNEQQEFFKDSVVRDDNGNLKVMYHGTSKGGFNTFDTYGSNYGLFGTGSYFTDSKTIAESYTNKGRGSNKQVYETYLNIKNPMDMDTEADADAWTKAFPDATFPSSGTNEDFYRAVEEYFADEEYAKWEAAEIAVGAIQEMGYDGITHIGGGRVNADGERHHVYIAFEPEQIKNIDNAKPTDHPDIRYSLTEEVTDAQNERGYSLSNEGDPFTPYNDSEFFGNDFGIGSSIAEEIAPVAKNATTTPTASKAEKVDEDNVAPVPKAEQPTTRKALHQKIVDNIRSAFKSKGFDFDEVLKKAKNLSTWSTVDNTPQRVMEKSLGYKEGGILADITVNKVAQNETEGIKWLNSYVDQLKQISKEYGIKPGSKESAAAQMFAEGFYVNDKNEIVRYGEPELIQDFGNADVRRRIKGLARDPRIRKIYDDTLAAINESRSRNLYEEIPRLDNYFLHFRAMEDTFSTLGLPFNPNDIRAKDLPTDLNGVTADLKPGQPYFSSAMHRTGKRTSFDLLGGVERYLNSAKNQIYHIDDIQTLRALRNYIAETYGQASGLEDIDLLSDAEAEERIKQVYGSHLSTFAKFLNEEANILAGKTALIDRGVEGIIGRRGITFLNTLNGQVGSNMVGYNISSSLTNFLPVAQTFAKTNKFDFTKAFAQTVANKFTGGKFDTFAKDSPVVIRRKGSDRFYQTPWQKMQNPGYALMGLVDDVSTEIIARTKYNEFTRKGMDSQKAHFETDKWVSKLMGDRSLGQQPQLYNSKMLGLVTKFQLEVRNQLDAQFYDTIQETKVSNEHIQNGLARNAKTAAKVASVFTQLAVAQHLYGMAFESIAGYNPAFDIIEVLMTAFGYDDEEDSEDTALDNLAQGFGALLEDLPYASTFTGGGRIPVSSAIPDVGAILNGEDEYGNEIGVPNAIMENVKDIAPYYLMPGGYGQAKKTYQGLKMFSDDHPIAGSYTEAGNLRFNVEDTAVSRIKAGIFGQYASENAQKYFDQEQRTLNPEQTEIFAGLDIPIEEYWKYRDNLYEFYDVKDQMKEAAYADNATDEDVLRYTYINNVYGSIYDLYDKQKEIASGNSRNKKSELRDLQAQMEQMLSNSKYAVDRMKLSGAYGEVGDKRYNKDADSGKWYEIKPKNADGSDNWYYQKEQEVTKGLGISYEEYWNDREEYNYAYDKPGKYAIAQAVGGYDSYMEHYDVLENWQSDNYISADKDSKGNSISGSRKKKVLDYIDGLDLDYGEKIILYRTVYSSKADKRTYNRDIIEYLNSRDDISYQQMEAILKELDFEVDSKGNITW